MKTLVLANHKGGVGKSAVATLLCHYLVRQGQRVLAIDLDHQGNLSKPLQRTGRVMLAPVSADLLLGRPVTAAPNHPFVLVASGDGLCNMERQPLLHNDFARNLRGFIRAVDAQFDVCVIDTHPNIDIRLISALASADYVLSPIQLTQEAVDGVHSLLNHSRAGLRKIKAVLNPRLKLIGLLPNIVDPTPFQRQTLIEVIDQYGHLLVRTGPGAGNFALMPKRSAILEAQAEGISLWDMKKTAARDTCREIEPSLARIVATVNGAIPLAAGVTSAGV